MVLLLLPFSLAMDDGELDHGGGGGSRGGPAAVTAVAGAAVDDNWRRKRPAMRASLVAWRRARKRTADNATINQIRE